MIVLALVAGLSLAEPCMDGPAAAALWRRAKQVMKPALQPAPAGRATVLRFERAMARDGETVSAQHVHAESLSTREPFQRLPDSLDVGRDGFVGSGQGTRRYFAPAPDVLVQVEFLRSYCLSLADPDSAQPEMAGLRFLPRAREAGRVDVDATLWIDTITPALHAVEFRYLGLHPSVDAYRPGGRLIFERFANGYVGLTHWTFRSVSGTAVRETGGHVARIRWDDGSEWAAPLGSVRVHTVEERGRRRPRTPIQLLNTSYAAVTDGVGEVEIRDLLPGPYEAVVIDPEFEAVGLPPVGRNAFRVHADSTAAVVVVVQTAEAFVEHACREVNLFTSGSYMVIGRIVDSKSRPALGAAWEINDLRRRATRIMPRGMADPATARGVVGSDGLFVYCRALDWGSIVEMKVWRNRGLLRGEPATVVVRSLNKRVTAVRIELPPEP